MMTGGEVEEEEVDMMVEVIIDVGIEEDMMSQDHRMVGNGPSQMVEEAGTKAIQIETGWTHSNTAVAKVSTSFVQISAGCHLRRVISKWSVLPTSLYALPTTVSQ